MSELARFSDSFCLIVEDHHGTCEFLDKIVKSAFPGIEVASVHDLQSAKSWIHDSSAAQKPFALCIVDLALPDGSGVEVIRELKKLKPESSSIVFSVYDDDQFLFDALAAGASGYLLKEEEPRFLVEALKKFEGGQPPLSPSIARRLLRHFHEVPSTEPEVKLSPREKETLELLARGMTVPEIATQLNLSAQTVAGYVKKIYQKLHVANRVELMREASRLRLL